VSLLFTVALCTHNHADRLERTLRDLRALRLPEAGWELLVIDNGCTDGTPALLAAHAWPAAWPVRVVREDRLGLSNARNRAAREARGEYIVFIDDDETPDPDWLCAYERLVTRHRPDAFGSRIRVLFEDTRPAWLQDELLGFLGEVHRFDEVVPLTDPDTYFFGGNFGCRTALVAAVGAFDPQLGRQGRVNIGGEEIDFYRRLLAAGHAVWWTPEAVIHHRIQAAKLSRGYFLDLHYRQGWTDASRDRGARPRRPPAYLWPQLARAFARALRTRVTAGSDRSLRMEMNAAYFVGYVRGWARAPAA
jgi:glycosyltransferase involved in cell wall biosynthesis